VNTAVTTSLVAWARLTRWSGCWAAMALLSALLAAQEKKTAPSELIWHYDSPRGFRLPEPAYRFPTQIKQALVQYVQPVPERTQAYATVCTDKHRFARWLQGLLLARKQDLAAAAGNGPTVLSSNPALRSPGPGTSLSTQPSRPHSRVAPELAAIEDYLLVLKLWDPEPKPQ